jgi:hypothetical protein
MEAVMSDEEDRPLGADFDLGEWEPQLPPRDFAERVLAEVRPRRRRWPYVVGTIAIAAGLLLALNRPPSSGEAIAKDRIEVPIGSRGIAVLEPGASVKWNGDDVVQSTGDVFYRVERGARFTVHTPAGEVEVKGTCFSVKVREMQKRDFKVAATSAALSALAFVAVYEGKVAVSHAAERVDLVAGETAQTGANGVKKTNGTVDQAVASASNGTDNPEMTANKNLVEQIGEYRSRLEKIAADKSELETKLQKTEAALAATKDGAPGVVKPEFDLSQDDWKDLAKEGTMKYQNPCINTKEPWQPSAESLNKLGLAPSDAPAITAAYKQSSDRLWGTIKPLCTAAVGSAEVATRIGPDTCISVILSTERDRDQDAATKAQQLVADIRAGNAPMPAPNAQLNPVTKLFLAMTDSSKDFENDLAQSFGPEEAHRLAYAESGMCVGRHVYGGDRAKTTARK